MDVDKLTLEEAMQELEGIAKRMEEEDATVDESVNLYARAKELEKHCRAKLEGYKERIQVMEGGQERPLDI